MPCDDHRITQADGRTLRSRRRCAAQRRRVEQRSVLAVHGAEHRELRVRAVGQDHPDARRAAHDMGVGEQQLSAGAVTHEGGARLPIPAAAARVHLEDTGRGRGDDAVGHHARALHRRAGDIRGRRDRHGRRAGGTQPQVRADAEQCARQERHTNLDHRPPAHRLDGTTVGVRRQPAVVPRSGPSPGRCARRAQLRRCT